MADKRTVNTYGLRRRYKGKMGVLKKENGIWRTYDGRVID